MAEDVISTGSAAPSLLARLRRSAIAQGIGSNIVNQIVVTFAQLALVPVFATRWGVALYGAWLLLFTLPAYIVMADLGLASAAGNDMVARVARGDRTGATAVYQAVRLVALGAGTAVAAGAALLLYVAAPGLLAGISHAIGGDARPVAMVLAAYGALGLVNSVAAQGHRATGGYALGGYLTAATLLAETIGAMLLVLAGRGPMTVALWYLAARIGGTAATSLTLARRASWMVTLRWASSAGTLRHLLRPAAATMLFPAAQATSLQGTVLVIGAVAGSAAVPVFTAVRTLSRVAVQAILVVNHAIMPALTAAHAVHDEARVTRYAAISFAVSLGLALPGALMLLAAGRPIVALWTHGALQPDATLLAIMAAAMVLTAIWAPAANLILAINRHEGYTWVYLLAAIAALGLCVPLTRMFGAAGAAGSVLLVEAVMLARVAVLSRRLELFDWRAVRSLLRRP